MLFAEVAIVALTDIEIPSSFITLGLIFFAILTFIQRGERLFEWSCLNGLSLRRFVTEAHFYAKEVENEKIIRVLRSK